MCGIIGIASNKSVTTNIIQSLKKLEYRGYDSAGIATIKNGDIDEKKCTGRVENLEKILFKKIYKLTKKIIGKSYFKNVLPNFGYKNGFMTVENEIINLIYILILS